MLVTDTPLMREHLWLITMMKYRTVSIFKIILLKSVHLLMINSPFTHSHTKQFLDLSKRFNNYWYRAISLSSEVPVSQQDKTFKADTNVFPTHFQKYDKMKVYQPKSWNKNKILMEKTVIYTANTQVKFLSPAA